MRRDPAQWLSFSLAREQDPDLRSVLTRVLHTGLRQCGAIGLVAALLYVGLSVFGLGYDMTWTYESIVNGALDHQIVAVGILVVAALSVIGLVLAQSRCSLQEGRLFGWGAILVAAAVATFEGAVRGAFSSEYVILVYLLVVAIIPFRPAQVVGIGGSVALMVYLLGPSGPAWTGGLGFSAGMAKHLLFLVGGSVLVTGASLVLYRRHRSFGAAQASLQKKQDLLRRTQEVAQVGGWEYDPDADAVRGTEELYRILGLPAEQAFDRASWLELYAPGARASVEQALERCLQEGTPFDLEVSLVTAQDERREVRLRGTAEASPDGSPRITGILQDITERQAMQKRLHEQERLLRSITGNVSDGLYRLVPGEGIVYANQAFAQLFGYDGAAEVLGLDPHALHAHAERQAAPLRVPEESTQNEEVLLRRKDGSTFVGLLGGAVVRDEDGTVQHIDGVVTDITDLKEREKTLKGERDRFETLFETLLQER